MSLQVAFSFRRRYGGPVQAVILDWAGTTVDFGSLAPAAVFVEVFLRQGVPITLEEARAPMGTAKRDHIRRITELPAVCRRWQEAHGEAPGEAEVEAMYADFVPRQLESLRRHAELIPGTAEAVAALRARGVRIGATTGYSREMSEIVLAAAERQGYRPDVAVSASDVPHGRPHPAMALKALIELGVPCVQASVVVDDTVPGIEAGLNAGMWAVGVAISGNEVGLTPAEWAALPADERQVRRERAFERLHRAGAHAVIDTIAELVPCIEAIEARLGRGEAP